jgi:hypothetical protein
VTPLKIASSDTSLPTTLLMTNTLSPMGGVIRPISSSLMTTMPNQTRFMSMDSISGTVRGMVSRMMPIGSRKVPSTI